MTLFLSLSHGLFANRVRIWHVRVSDSSHVRARGWLLSIAGYIGVYVRGSRRRAGIRKGGGEGEENSLPRDGVSRPGAVCGSPRTRPCTSPFPPSSGASSF